MNANKFAEEWIKSWNSHDLEDVMKHYTDDLEITTPMIKLAGGIESGSLSGKENVKEYWAKALAKFPDLKFELIDVTSGVNSVALYYKSIMDKKAVEVMFFNENGLVNKMIAHYTDL
ncbi:SnoaL-like protein [Flavobacterium sp. 270]|uniref:nuclear transport factor 2 family protein n=1 Tax=Flavobacterium sp. 270 TaxID=2512114 RepID=UPI001066FD5C|nr:nuclear transport factor 2 family protein [Flavobacterium sp. 270]TDW51491.1 SnoaL-like protein [Flavobacterium sp. 270]